MIAIGHRLFLENGKIRGRLLVFVTIDAATIMLHDV